MQRICLSIPTGTATSQRDVGDIHPRDLMRYCPQPDPSAASLASSALERVTRNQQGDDEKKADMR